MRRERRSASQPASRASGDGSSVWEILPAIPRQPAAGRAVTRRSVLAGMSALGAAALTGCGGGDDTSAVPTFPGPLCPRPDAVPRLTMASGPADPVTGWFTLNFKFSARVDNFDTNDFVVKGGTVVPGSFAPIPLSEYAVHSEYAVRIAPFPDLVGEVELLAFPFVNCSADVVFRFTQAYDTTSGALGANWASIRDTQYGGFPLTGGPVVLILTVNLRNGGRFSVGEVGRALSVIGADIDEVTVRSDREYLVVVTPLAGARYITVTLDPGTLGVPVNAIASPGGWNPVQWVRSVPGNWVSFSDSWGKVPWAGEPLTLTVSFNVRVTRKLTPEALGFPDWVTLSEFTQVSDTVYTVRVTPPPFLYRGGFIGCTLEPWAVGVVPMYADGFEWTTAIWRKWAR